MEELNFLVDKGLLVGRGCLRLGSVTGFHGGNYTCVAENGLGTARHTVKVDVLSEWPNEAVRGSWSRF